MAAITDRLPEVDIEYDSRGKRATKHFEDAHAAKRFFTAKLNDGKNPTVKGDGSITLDDGAIALDPAGMVAVDADLAALNANVAAAKGGDVGPATLSLPKATGVNCNATTRALVAGKVLAKYGHAGGVTEAMIAEVDAEFGKPNAVESGIHLRNAYHAIRGFFEANGMAIPAAPAEVAK